MTTDYMLGFLIRAADILLEPRGGADMDHPGPRAVCGALIAQVRMNEPDWTPEQIKEMADTLRCQDCPDLHLCDIRYTVDSVDRVP
jgi:hypothetical protein